ncbi:MAG: TlpA family protein disulfide reductase [Acidothermus sp.]|nr:TlpA family protein disulfide reductase [Acidothermus sp.]MCL6537271.1 TlpA family protein disulfide reductase [Acidothermus sp.]
MSKRRSFRRISSSWRQVFAGIAAILAAASVAACGSSAGRSSSPAVSTTPTPSLRTLDGQAVHVPSDRPVVLVFYSIGCADCAVSTRNVMEAARQDGSRARYLGVDLDPGVDAATVNRFLDSVGAGGLPTVVDSSGKLAYAYHVSALSEVIVVDSSGKVAFRAVDPSPQAILAAVARAA